MPRNSWLVFASGRVARSALQPVGIGRADLRNNDEAHAQEGHAGVGGPPAAGGQQAGGAHHADAHQAARDAAVVQPVQGALQEGHRKDGREQDLRSPQHLVHARCHIPAPGAETLDTEPPGQSP